MYSPVLHQQLLPSLSVYIVYLFSLLLAFYLGFYIVMKNSYGYSFHKKIRYSITAGLLSTKFIVFIATLLGIDHVFFIIVVAHRITIPVTANMILLLGNLLAVISLNWERISSWFNSLFEEEF